MTAAIRVFTKEEITGKTLEAAYRQHGVCVIARLVPPDIVVALRAEADRLVSAVAGMAGSITGSRPALDGSMLFERLDPVSDESPLIAELAVEKTLLALAGRLTGGGGVPLKDKLIYKFPGDKGYNLHQEFPYFHECDISPDELVIIGIAIDPMRSDNGELTFFLGYHDSVQPAPAHNERDVDPSAVSRQRSATVQLEPGDAVVFHSLAPHCSGPNLSSGTRRILYLTYTNDKHPGARADYYRYRSRLSQADIYGS